MLVLQFLLNINAAYVLFRGDRIGLIIEQILVLWILNPIIKLVLVLLLLVDVILILSKCRNSCRLLLKLWNNCMDLLLIWVYLLRILSDLWILTNVKRSIVLRGKWNNSNIIGCHPSILFVHLTYIVYHLPIHFIEWSLWPQPFYSTIAKIFYSLIHWILS
jgi:hypothetical protein